MTMCRLCVKQGTPRIYSWVVRRGLAVPDENDTLEVCLCDRCHMFNQSTKLVGSNWWDATDRLRRPPTASEIPRKIDYQTACLKEEEERLKEVKDELAWIEVSLDLQKEEKARLERLADYDARL